MEEAVKKPLWLKAEVEGSMLKQFMSTGLTGHSSVVVVLAK
jgi:hypothetical protein